MVRIRLARRGKNKKPTYRIVIADARSPRDGRFIEIIGNYNPVQQPKVLNIKTDRARYWLSVGAQPSDTVAHLLKQQGVDPKPGTPFVPGQEIEPVIIAQTPPAPQPVQTVMITPEPQPVAETQPVQEPVETSAPLATEDADLEAEVSTTLATEEMPDLQPIQEVEAPVQEVEVPAEPRTQVLPSIADR